MTKRTEKIYVLIEKGIATPKYVGHSVDPERRLQQHIDEAVGGGNSLKCHWIRSVLHRGGEIDIRVVDECGADELADLEHYWINELEWQGVQLWNGNKGVKGSKIDEVALKHQIAEAKRQKRKKRPLEPFPKVDPAVEKAELAKWLHMYETDPLAFKQEGSRRAELEKESRRLKRKSRNS